MTYRPVDNPAQRFLSHYVEWLEEPPPARLRVHEEHATKSILSRNESPDVPFTWSVNPYRGCTHACAYCYARPTHEYLDFGAGTDFETQIIVKTRAADLLEEALRKRTWKHELIAFSGDTDCYQPLESHYELTRRCLEACVGEQNPVGIITKSHLITRDVDLLRRLHDVTSLTVNFSIAFDDADTARALEPGAPRPAKRFEAMRVLSEAGVRTGLIFGPIIPGLNEEAIPRVLERAKDAGARWAGSILLRLPHSVKDIFLERLRAKLPLRAGRVESRIREVRGGDLTETRFGKRMRGEGVYWDAISRLFRVHAERLGLARSSQDGELPQRPRSPRLGEQLGLFGGGD